MGSATGRATGSGTLTETLRNGTDRHGAKTPRWFVPVACGVLAAVGAAVYGNNLHGPFVFDDQYAIVDNESIRRVFPVSDLLLRAPVDSSAAGRPVGNFTFAVNYAVGGYGVVGYHVGNILVHVLCAIALFAVIRRTLQTEALRDRFATAAAPLAFSCALLWMLHPTQTECVNYVTQRYEMLMGLFYFLTLYLAILGMTVRRAGWWCAAAGRFDLAVMTGQRAVQLARKRGATALADAIADRLALYRQGKAYSSPRPGVPTTGPAGAFRGDTPLR